MCSQLVSESLPVGARGAHRALAHPLNMVAQEGAARDGVLRHRGAVCAWRRPCGYGVLVREVELWQRINAVLPEGYGASWADQVVMEELGSRTVRQALEAGIPCKRIWRAVWAQLELPENLR